MAEDKTKNGYYNEDDFVQSGCNMNELTVTITLCEYRKLISGQIQDEFTITRLQNEVYKLKATNETLSKTLIAKCPGFVKSVSDGLSSIFTSEPEKPDKKTADADSDEAVEQPDDAELRGEEYYANQGDEE